MQPEWLKPIPSDIYTDPVKFKQERLHRLQLAVNAARTNFLAYVADRADEVDEKTPWLKFEGDKPLPVGAHDTKEHAYTTNPSLFAYIGHYKQDASSAPPPRCAYTVQSTYPDTNGIARVSMTVHHPAAIVHGQWDVPPEFAPQVPAILYYMNHLYMLRYGHMSWNG